MTPASTTTRSRFLAIAPITAGLLLSAAVCYAHSEPRQPPDTGPVIDERIVPGQDTPPARASARIGCPHARAVAAHRAERSRAELRPATSSVSYDHQSARNERRACRRGSTRRYGLYLILLVGWYALGVAVMPWIARRR